MEQPQGSPAKLKRRANAQEESASQRHPRGSRVSPACLMVENLPSGFNGINGDFPIKNGGLMGFYWDLMGFIRIYDGIPSGND